MKKNLLYVLRYLLLIFSGVPIIFSIIKLFNIYFVINTINGKVYDGMGYEIIDDHIHNPYVLVFVAVLLVGVGLIALSNKISEKIKEMKK